MMNMRDSLQSLLKEHSAVARVMVVDAQGSTPREVGAWVWVTPTTSIGTIGGGQLEFSAIKRARGYLKNPTLKSYLEHVALGPSLGQCCGGKVSLFSEIYTEESLLHFWDLEVWARPIQESLLSAPLPIMPARVKELMCSSEQTIGVVDGWVIENFRPQKHAVWLYGAGHVGKALITIMAELDEFALHVVETSQDRMPMDFPENVTPILAARPETACVYADKEAHHLVMTHDHVMDLAICHALLGKNTASIGLIGSKTKWARFQKRLVELGHSASEIARIRCPLGDPSLGKQPMAIAVGTVNELLSPRLSVEQSNVESLLQRSAVA